jgi:hypothetical protein
MELGSRSGTEPTTDALPNHPHRKTRQNQIGSAQQASAEMEESALWIILAVEAGIVMLFFALAVSLLW